MIRECFNMQYLCFKPENKSNESHILPLILQRMYMSNEMCN